MKNMLHYALALLLFPCLSYGQCYISAHRVSEVHVHDTTYQMMVVDTSITGISGFTYTWQYDNGSTYSGTTAALPITDASVTRSYTITASAPGTTCNSNGTVNTAVVFNCAMLPALSYGYPGSYTFMQPIVTDPNSVYIQYGYTPVSDLNLKVNMHLDWGNGTIINTTQALDTLSSIGGIANTTQSSHYRYAGQYIIKTLYTYSYDTLTCPATIMPKTAIWVAGRAGAGAPQIAGNLAYCIGDTLRLSIADTIAQFRNAYHRADTTGVTNYDIVPMIGGAYPVYGPNRLYSWSHDGSYFGLSLDTTLTIPNLTMADTGIYYMQMWENISLTDTVLKVHVTINNAAPAVAAITGASSVCEGNAITLSSTTSGGTWSSSSSAASVSSGVVSGINAGSAVISYTVANGCGATTVTYPVNVVSSSVCAAGIAETNTDNAIRVFPNPSYGSFTVSAPGADATITVTDVTGKTIDIIKSQGKTDTHISLNNLASGTYLIKVDCGGNVYRDKVIIW